MNRKTKTNLRDPPQNLHVKPFNNGTFRRIFKMYWNPDQSDEEEEIEEQTFGGRDGFIALIDCRRSMFDEDESSTAKFRTCLETLEKIMLTKITTSERDLIGVVLFNTVNSPPPAHDSDSEPGLIVPKNTAILIPMKVSSAETIKFLKNFQESDDLLDFSRKYGHIEDCNFADALWLCSRMFTRCGFKLQQSHLVLFTDNDQPHPSGSYQYQQAFVKAKDYQQLGIRIVLVPMDENFDGNKFYKEFICTALNIEDFEEYELPQFTLSMSILMHRVLKRDYRKRSLLHLKMKLSDDVSFGVNLYTFVRKSKYPKAFILMRDTNEIIQSKKSYMTGSVINEETEEIAFNKPLMPGDQRKVQVIGNEKITFTIEEVTKMKQMLAPGLKLLGFKPIDKISLHNHARNCLFLYPDEDATKGSVTIFRALWEKCLEKRKMAFCILTMRRKSSSQLVALIPQENYSTEDDMQIRYNGFRVEFVPYAADIRRLEMLDQDTPETTNEEKELMRKLIKKLRFKYSPDQFPTPVLKSLYIALEGLVFGETGAEFEDTTLPSVEYQDSKVKQIAQEINNAFGVDDEAAKKRPASTPSSNSAPKVPKRSDATDVDSASIIAAINNGTAEKLLVSTLKAYLQQIGVKGLTKLNKAGLIEKIKQHHDL